MTMQEFEHMYALYRAFNAAMPLLAIAWLALFIRMCFYVVRFTNRLEALERRLNEGQNEKHEVEHEW